MVQYKLCYFNAKGRAEIIRYVFAAAGVEYEDVRFEGAQWPEHKKTSPTGQAPFLEIHDDSNTTVLAQSITITRYLGRKFDLAGKGELEQAEVEMYADQASDLLGAYIKARWEKDEARKSEFMKTLHDETLSTHLTVFESWLAKSGSGFLAASGLTYADLYLTLVSESIVEPEKREQVFSAYPHVKKLIETVNGHPNIAAWVAKRPVTEN